MQAQCGDLCTESNVAMSGIHMHSGPGGYLRTGAQGGPGSGLLRTCEQQWRPVRDKE